MEKVVFNISESLKMSFQLKTIREKTTMTDVLVNFIQEYIKDDNKNNYRK